MPKRRTATAKERTAICGRLQELIRQDFKTIYEFRKKAEARKLGLARTTIAAWFGKSPNLPDGYTFALLAEEFGWSPTFILTGKGPIRVGGFESGPELQRSLYEYLRLKLKRSKVPGFDQFLERYLPLPDELLAEFVATYQTKSDAAWRAWRGDIQSRLRQFLARRSLEGRGAPAQVDQREVTEAFNAMLRERAKGAALLREATSQGKDAKVRQKLSRSQAS